MEWLADNWFFTLIFAAFVALHLIGHDHGHHAGHDRTHEEGREGE